MSLTARLRRRPDSEHEQALIRLAIGGLACCYILFSHLRGAVDPDAGRTALWAVMAFLVFSIGLIAAIIAWPGVSPARRVAGAVADMSATSYAMYVLGESGAVFFPVYLWVISGNGLRFGRAYLLMAMALAVIGFVGVITTEPFWLSQPRVAAALLIGLIVLPLYIATLVGRLQKSNDELKRLYREMAEQATHDQLTGLPNRLLFEDRLERALALARRHQRTFAVMFIDLDGFKQVNDRFGHAAGDEVIRTVSGQVARRLRECDTVARLGGDEFIVLLSEMGSPPKPERVAEDLLAALADGIVVGGERVRVTASIGIAVYPGAGEAPQALIQSADAAMYLAKRQGKNRYCLQEKPETAAVRPAEA